MRLLLFVVVFVVAAVATENLLLPLQKCINGHSLRKRHPELFSPSYERPAPSIVQISSLSASNFLHKITVQTSQNISLHFSSARHLSIALKYQHQATMGIGGITKLQLLNH